MTAQQVIELMESSKTEKEWNDNCDKVKAAYNGDYPDFWFKTIIFSGLSAEIATRFGKDDKIHILTFE